MEPLWAFKFHICHSFVASIAISRASFTMIDASGGSFCRFMGHELYSSLVIASDEALSEMGGICLPRNLQLQERSLSCVHA